MFEKIEKFVSCVCVSVMAILVFANVVSRFAFKHSMAVSDEMSTYLFVLMSFMGTAIAARRKAHLGLSIVTDHVSPRARLIIGLLMYAVSALFCLLIVIFGIQMVPVGAAFAMIAFLQTMVQMYKDYQAEEDN